MAVLEMRNNVGAPKKSMNRLAALRLSNFKNLTELLLLFQVMALVLVMFYDTSSLNSSKVLFSLSLILIVFVTNKLLPRLTRGDTYILMIATMLFSIGAVMIYRIRPDLGMKQVIWFTLGMILFYATYFIMKMISGWERWTLFYFVVCLSLFLITLIFGSTVNGAKNWIIIRRGEQSLFSFQLSELAKIALVFMISSYYYNVERYRDLQLGEKKIGNLLMMIAVYIFIGFLFLQKDLGTVVIFFAVMLIMQFIYEKSRKLILLNLGLAIGGGALGVLLFNHVRIRIVTWLDPWKYIDGVGYQITQALFAISSGGFFGTGIGMGKPTTIPLSYSDFIFASICEEMGVFMGMAVIMLLLILVYRGYKIALAQKHKFFRMVAIGITSTFAIQSLVIFGGVLKLIPLTGITIPFVSYGGSAILSSFIALGVLQFTSEEIEIKEASDEKTKNRQ